MTLIAQIRACTQCASALPLPPKPILQLSAAAPIFIAGQAPGIRAHNYGQAFRDPSGERLRDWLGVNEQIFYDSRYFAIVPMGFCYPGTGEHGDLAPLSRCAQVWRQRVMQELGNTKLTLLLGQYAMQYHTDKRYKTVTAAVKDWRANWPELLVLPHPSPRNNRWLKHNPWFEQDVLPRLKERVAELLNEN